MKYVNGCRVCQLQAINVNQAQVGKDQQSLFSVGCTGHGVELSWQVQPTVCCSVVHAIEVSTSVQFASHMCCLN